MPRKFFRPKIDVNKLPLVIRHKWQSRVLEEGITSVPKMLLRNLSRIFAGEHGTEELQVALTLVDYQRPGNTRFPTLTFLAFLAGLPEETFQRHLTELERRDLIRVTKVRQALDFDVSGLMRKIQHLSAWQPANRAPNEVNAVGATEPHTDLCPPASG